MIFLSKIWKHYHKLNWVSRHLFRSPFIIYVYFNDLIMRFPHQINQLVIEDKKLSVYHYSKAEVISAECQSMFCKKECLYILFIKVSYTR